MNPLRNFQRSCVVDVTAGTTAPGIPTQTAESIFRCRMYSARKPLTKRNLTRKPSIFGFHSLNNLRKNGNVLVSDS